MWTKLYRAELLKNIRFSLALPAINDMLFNVDVLLNASKVVVSNRALIAYRIINTSQTMKKLSLQRIDEYKNLAIEFNQLTKKYPQYKNILEKIAAKYAYGMFIDEVINKYNLKHKTDGKIFRKIKDSLDFLIKNKIIKVSRLSIVKRFSFWKFILQLHLQYK